ncbi:MULTISPECIES: hypothetical protein [unclassified Carboxylicivirga]|uniref:hypothetical protein n=1 Tax=Carboxylicivirga TaxID=1628153 RepID=UPI003D32DA8B
MKTLSLSLLFAMMLTSIHAQNLIDIYKRGTVKLTPDDNYANNNDWNKVFETYYDTVHSKPMGIRKSLIITPNGSAVVNHAYRNYYTKFTPDGTYQTEFGIINSSGNRFKKTTHISGVINGNTFFTGLDNMGNMRCLDLEGNYKKTLKLDYMTSQMIPLPNGKIAVVGWVIWAKKFRDFVAIVDYETNEEQVIWEHFTDRDTPRSWGGSNTQTFHYSYTFKKQGAVSCSTMPFTRAMGIKARPKLACINKRLIIANPSNGELQTFDLEGNLLSKKKMNLLSGEISAEEQKKIQQKAIDRYKGMNPLRFAAFDWVNEDESRAAHQYFIEAMLDDYNKISEPIKKPYFATVIKDSDDNLLFFDFPENENANRFNVWVYKNGGEFICQSSFACNDYELQINPDKLVFHKGYLYGLQILKEANGVPLRLVRFSLSEPK